MTLYTDGRGCGADGMSDLLHISERSGTRPVQVRFLCKCGVGLCSVNRVSGWVALKDT